MTRIITAAVLLFCLAATGSADHRRAPCPATTFIAKLHQCRTNCRLAVRTDCLFPHPGMRRGAIRRCLPVCLYGGDANTICTLRQVLPPGGSLFGCPFVAGRPPLSARPDLSVLTTG